MGSASPPPAEVKVEAAKPTAQPDAAKAVPLPEPGKLGSLGAATVVCVVDLDTLAESDATLKDDISKYRSNSAQIKPALEGNSAVMDVIKAQHPTFDINHVVGTDIGPSGELVLYVSRS